VPRIAVYSTGRSVAGVLELLKTTTMRTKLPISPRRVCGTLRRLRCLNCDGELQACLQGCAGDIAIGGLPGR
jgi:hypothetical protein